MGFFGLSLTETPAEALFAEAYLHDARIKRAAELLANGTHEEEGFNVAGELADFADERGLTPDTILAMLVKYQQNLRPVDPRQ